MSNLLRFTGITFVIIVAVLLALAVGGVLSSDELWHNIAKVAELVGILLVASGLVMVLTKNQ